MLNMFGFNVCEINSNLSQSERVSALENFKIRKFDILLATDLAGRGLDMVFFRRLFVKERPYIKDLQVVINFEMPVQMNRYIHRGGRTAWAVKAGISLSICTKEEARQLR